MPTPAKGTKDENQLKNVLLYTQKFMVPSVVKMSFSVNFTRQRNLGKNRPNFRKQSFLTDQIEN